MTAGPAWSTPVAATLTDRLAALDRALGLAGERFGDAETAPAEALLEHARQRLGRSPLHTVVALAGGTGSGKSSLFNALVGAALSPVGVRRPATEEPLACVWGDAGPDDPAAASLLDWIGVSRRARLVRTTMLDPRPDPALEGLVLIDLPDHDTVRTEHLGIIDRVVDNADLVLWVVDPQKYADAALHERYLSRMAGRDAALAVVMNQLDRVEASTAPTLGADLRRLLEEDGLGSAAVLAASAATGGGLPALRGLLVERVSQRRAAVLRLEAELTTVVAALRASLGTAPMPVTAAEAHQLVSALIFAVAGDAVVDRLLAGGRLREPVVVSENHVEKAVAALVEAVFDPFPLHWRRFGERLVDPRTVAAAVASAMPTLDVTRAGPSRLRRLFLSRERVETLRRQAVREAVSQAVASAAGQTVLSPIARELSLWPMVVAALEAAGRPGR
jgi:GTP-binding protein EngB required for normal cell division